MSPIYSMSNSPRCRAYSMSSKYSSYGWCWYISVKYMKEGRVWYARTRATHPTYPESSSRSSRYREAPRYSREILEHRESTGTHGYWDKPAQKDLRSGKGAYKGYNGWCRKLPENAMRNACCDDSRTHDVPPSRAECATHPTLRSRYMARWYEKGSRTYTRIQSAYSIYDRSRDRKGTRETYQRKGKKRFIKTIFYLFFLLLFSLLYATLRVERSIFL